MRERDDYIGQVLDGRYRVERLLGAGGMGSVYEGRHAIVGKRVAIKMLHAEFAANEEVLKRFYREAQAAAAIGHKNIIDVVDVGVTAENEPYLVMEYLEGEDLEGMLERTGPVSLEAACGILEPALLALAAAHEKGIVHRDLKPANIFLCREAGGHPTVKLIDFGISKISNAGQGTKLTQTGSLLGTPAFMAPEQARGELAVDHRVDIYAMGVILYQMLTGTLPFGGDNYNSLLLNVLTQEPRPLREIVPSIPADAEALVLKELSKDPARRSQGALEMLEAFKNLAAFAERDSGLSLLGTRLRKGVASGDIGKTRGGAGGPSSASRVLSQMARGTPGVWAGTGGTAVRRGSKPALVIGLAAAALVVAGVVVVALVKQSTGKDAPVAVPAAASVVAPAAAPVVDDVVQITVEGAPPGATILFDGAPASINPLPVKRGRALTKLEVQADGFEPFVTSVIPAADTVVKVAMQPAKGRSGESSRAKKKDEGVAEKAPPPAPPPAPAAKSQEQRLKDGKRGTKIGTDFE